MIKRNIPFTNPILIIVFFLSFSRGLYQTFYSQSISYLVTLVCFFIFSLLIIKNLKFLNVNYLAKSLLFLVISFLSLFFSNLNNQSYDLYILVPLFFIFTLNVYKNSTFKSLNNVFILNCILLIFLVLSYLEIFYGQLFIGSEKNYYSFAFHSIRPSALTGSYLHFSIIVSFLYIYMFSNSKKHSFWHAFIILSILLLYSRTALLIIFLFYFFYFLSSFSLKNIYFYLFFLFSLIIFFFIFNEKITEIITLLFSIEGIGNFGRYNTWISNINELSFSNLFLGTHFGLKTKMNSIIEATDMIVVESSFLSLILNYGLIGCLLFYKLLFDFLKGLKFRKTIFVLFFSISILTQPFDSIYIIILFVISRVFLPKHMKNKQNESTIIIKN